MPRYSQNSSVLVTCDLPCVLQVDGEKKESINPDSPLKVPVGLGVHIFVATTTDGKDKLKKEIKVGSTEQGLVEVSLAPIRAHRLKRDLVYQMGGLCGFTPN